MPFYLLLFGLLFGAAAGPQAGAAALFFDEADAFFGAHVVDGRVDYAAVRADAGRLERLVSLTAAADREAFSPDEDKAFLLNAYNLLAVYAVVRAYPVASPTDVEGFFDEQTYTVAGDEMTLDELEKGALFPAYPDVRLHFALVCAAAGCPDLLDAAYRPETLDRQLDRQTRRALARPHLVRVDAEAKEIVLSELFRWYEDDFKREAVSLRAYIDRYRGRPLPADYSIRFAPYDWRLNDIVR